MNHPVKFAYPRSQFLIRTLVLSAMLAFIVAFALTLRGMNWFWPAVFFFIFFSFIIITNISPLFTKHQLDGEAVTLRQGLLFHSRLLFSEIESVEKQDHPLWKFAVPSSRARSRIVVASGNRGLVLIRFKARKRFKSLLFRSATEIIIDLENPDRFIESVRERLS